MVLALFLCTLVLCVLQTSGNVGFEYEIGMFYFETESWELFGIPFPGKILGVSRGGWWEIQLDENPGSSFGWEFVVPPTRLHEGFPDQGPLIQQEVCPALDDLQEYMHYMNHVLYKTQPAYEDSYAYEFFMPGHNINPMYLPFEAHSGYLEKELSGRFQATLGLPLRDVIPFFAKTIPHQDFFFKRDEYFSAVFNSVVSESQWTHETQAVLLLLGLLYHRGNDFDEAFHYIKQILSVLWRTDLGEVYTTLPEKDRQAFARVHCGESECSVDDPSNQGKGLAKVVVRMLQNQFPTREYSPFIYRNGIYIQSEVEQGPSLEDVTESLAIGVDWFKDKCVSIGSQSYAESGEIVLELRRIMDPDSHRQALDFMRDILWFVSEFKRNPDSIEFERGGGVNLCRPEERVEEIIPRKLWFTYQSYLVLVKDGDDFMVGSPYPGKVLGTGVGGWWQTYIDREYFSIQIPPHPIHPEGIALRQHRQAQIEQSLRGLEQFVHASEQSLAVPKVDSDGNVFVKLTIPGISLIHPPELNFALESPFQVSLDGILFTTVELPVKDAFDFIHAISAQTSCKILRDDLITLVLLPLSQVSVSSPAKLFLLLVILNTIHLEFPMYTEYDLSLLYLHLSGYDIDVFSDEAEFFFEMDELDQEISGILNIMKVLSLPEADREYLFSIVERRHNMSQSEPSAPETISIQLSGFCANGNMMLESIRKISEIINSDSSPSDYIPRTTSRMHQTAPFQTPIQPT